MKFFRSLWILLAVLYSLFFLLSCFSGFIPPSKFQYISFPALTFPFLFVGQVFNVIILLFIHKRAALLGLLCLCFSFWNVRSSVAFNGKKDFAMNKDSTTLRVMTWNVQNFYRNAYNKPFKLINGYNADVVCLQDYAANQIEDDMQMAGYPYSSKTNQGVVLFSKFPIIHSETPVADTSTGERFVVADIKVNADTIRVYSVHLQSYALFADTTGSHSRLGNYKIGYDRKRYFVRRIRDVEKIHERQAKFIRQHMLTTTHPVIFCGDVNSVPTSYTYRTLADGLKDTHLEKGFFLGGTYFHLFPTLRIDLCLADPRFTVTQKTVDQQKLSDHKAVIADLILKR
jgi:endonuclease/exonuclease/phosphatase family metal-dependent hydrolase